MHDIARAGKTFGIRGFFIVTPLEDQKKLAREVIDHWVCGVGGQLNPFRKQALELITIVTSFSDAVEEIKARDKKLSIEEMTGGTFSLTNGGVFGSLLSTPIVNPPQSAILGNSVPHSR
jgi:hypothetical protein